MAFGARGPGAGGASQAHSMPTPRPSLPTPSPQYRPVFAGSLLNHSARFETVRLDARNPSYRVARNFPATCAVYSDPFDLDSGEAPLPFGFVISHAGVEDLAPDRDELTWFYGYSYVDQFYKGYKEQGCQRGHRSAARIEVRTFGKAASREAQRQVAEEDERAERAAKRRRTGGAALVPQGAAPEGGA